MNDVFNIFDAWEPLFKARKAKGLDKWAKLKPLAEKLAGKDVKAIAFTCSHPSHAGEPVRHLLGSVEGNLHFMLGYGNPKFHLAPYHWQIIDPNTTSEEADETFSRMKHPANPALWARAGIEAGEEGDTGEGESHPLAAQAKAKKTADDSRQAESIKAKSPTGSYTCVPSEGLVYGDHNGHVYRWDLIKDSFFSAFNPQVTVAMDEAAIQKSKQVVLYRSMPSELVKSIATQCRGMDFDLSVYPLVKSRLPKPGSILKLESDQGESVFGVVTTDSIQFYTKTGSEAEVKLFDRVYKSFDLIPAGNVPPAALLSFVVKNFKVNASLLNEVTKKSVMVQTANEFGAVEGEPTIGYDDVPSVYTEGIAKSVTTDTDGVWRVVVRL